MVSQMDPRPASTVLKSQNIHSLVGQSTFGDVPGGDGRNINVPSVLVR